jgi:hypothetical protein
MYRSNRRMRRLMRRSSSIEGCGGVEPEEKSKG